MSKKETHPLKTRKQSEGEISYTNHPIRVAILIDGGFFIKRFNNQWNKDKKMSPQDVCNHLYTLAHSHVGKENYLYRIFYYDCLPLEKRVHIKKLFGLFMF